MMALLYRKYYTELIRWCRSMTRSSAQAEDLIQETFLRAIQNQETLETLREQQQRAWLYRTARNLYVDQMRRGAFFQYQEDPSPEGWEQDPSLAVVWKQMLLHLTEEERTLFVMRYLQGYTSSELGEIFGLPPGTVRAKLARSREKLRKEWEE